MATGAATAWSPSVTLTRYALGLVGTRATGAPEIVYAGGEGVAALDGETADPVGWNPEVFGPVYALGVGSSHVFIGGEIEGTGIRSLRLAAVVEHSTATLVAMFAAEAVTEGIVLRWRIAAPELVSSWIERAESAGGPWERPALEVRDRGEEHEALDRGVEASRTYHYRLLANDGRESIVLGTLTATAGAQYERHALTRIVPVPSAGRTGIDFVTARSSPVRLRIFDLHGRIEAELVDEILPAGNHRVIWTGQGVRGRSPAGIYFARLDVDGHGMARRIVLSR